MKCFFLLLLPFFFLQASQTWPILQALQWPENCFGLKNRTWLEKRPLKRVTHYLLYERERNSCGYSFSSSLQQKKSCNITYLSIVSTIHWPTILASGTTWWWGRAHHVTGVRRWTGYRKGKREKKVAKMINYLLNSGAEKKRISCI